LWWKCFNASSFTFQKIGEYCDVKISLVDNIDSGSWNGLVAGISLSEDENQSVILYEGYDEFIVPSAGELVKEVEEGRLILSTYQGYDKIKDKESSEENDQEEEIE